MGEAPETAEPDRDEARAAAAAAASPDPVTAELLAKHSAGERLSSAEYGRLGAWKSKLARLFGRAPGKDGAPAGSAQAGPGDAPGVATVAPGEAPDSGLAVVPIDAGLVQRTTGAVLTRCESIARRYVTTAAREAGAPAETVARVDRAACLPKDDRALMVELAPDVFTSLGLNPRHYPLAVFFGTAGLWATDLWLAVQELKAMKEGRMKLEADAVQGLTR